MVDKASEENVERQTPLSLETLRELCHLPLLWGL
jgi:hypothetical protein